MAMKKGLIIFAILLVIQLSSTAKVPPPPAKPLPPTVQANIFEDLSKKTTEFVTVVGKQVNQLVNAKDAVELQVILKNNTNEFIAKVTELAKNFQEQVKTTASDSDNVVGQVVSKLNQTVADLQKQHPEITGKAKEIQDNLQKGFKNVLTEADKITKSIAENTKEMQDDIAKLAKKAYDQVLSTAQSLQKQIHEYANKPVNNKSN